MPLLHRLKDDIRGVDALEQLRNCAFGCPAVLQASVRAFEHVAKLRPEYA